MWEALLATAVEVAVRTAIQTLLTEILERPDVIAAALARLHQSTATDAVADPDLTAKLLRSLHDAIAQGKTPPAGPAGTQ